MRMKFLIKKDIPEFKLIGIKQKPLQLVGIMWEELIQFGSYLKFLVKDGDQYKYETVTKDNSSRKTVRPAEGFLVKVGGVYAETSRFRLYIHFTEDMMVTAPQQ